MKQSLGIIAAILFGAALAQPAKADITFYFSFTNTEETVNGTVKGYVVLPDVCTNCAAIDVVLTSFPAGLDNPFGGPPLNVTPLFTDVFSDTFTVTSGAVSAADLNINNSSAAGLRLNDSGGINALEFVPGAALQDETGLSGLAFTSAPSAVPEPNSVILMSIALLAVALVARKRNARGRSPATRTNR
jgi:hypothetical protein